MQKFTNCVIVKLQNTYNMNAGDIYSRGFVLCKL
uniref:Prolyl 4-Hydroxylase alpha-subunit, N-terminal region n=1 Tax=Siphoviridae sp. ctmxA102 TaxID=2825657 RepID=A0A8S5TVW5_9CAUD|nr:MAG TPA: Prolyl 4-Hydroxylase alpha-subunit, N-terminal region [Siphoviridae sp. ctmxA102]